MALRFIESAQIKGQVSHAIGGVKKSRCRGVPPNAHFKLTDPSV